MKAPALLAVAHGSRDPRAEMVLEALVARVRAERPGVEVTLAHLGHTTPDVGAALGSLVAQGIREVVVVPLLLTAAYHSRVDLPAVLTEARLAHPDLTVTQSQVLGPHPLLFSLVKRRLAETGADASTSVVLGAIGTSDSAANAELADVAATLGASIGFAAGAPDIAEVVDGVRAAGAAQIAIASYVLAPGKLPDRFLTTQADFVTRPLGAEPEIVDVVLERYDAVVRQDPCRGDFLASAR
jgi:sirohydrochlorin ferrochelatase